METWGIQFYWHLGNPEIDEAVKQKIADAFEKKADAWLRDILGCAPIQPTTFPPRDDGPRHQIFLPGS